MRISASKSRQLVGKEVKGVTLDNDEQLTLGFSDGTVLQVGSSSAKLTVLVSPGPKPIHSNADTPTKTCMNLPLLQHLSNCEVQPALRPVRWHYRFGLQHLLLRKLQANNATSYPGSAQHAAG